uniref:Uncharacterized protein n=1 Tax=Glossina morsitans morsitans TaxID=37546 RepID=A0A1B0GDR6_GLOMM
MGVDWLCVRGSIYLSWLLISSKRKNTTNAKLQYQHWKGLSIWCKTQENHSITITRHTVAGDE